MKDFFEKISHPLSLITMIFCLLPFFGLHVEAATFILSVFCAGSYFMSGRIVLGSIWVFTSILWMIQI